MLWGKWKYHELFGKIRAYQHRILSQGLLDINKRLFGLNWQLEITIISQHISNIFYNLNKVCNKSSQEIYLAMEGLDLFLFLGLNWPLEITVLSQHISNIFYNLNKVCDKSSQEIYLAEEILYLFFYFWAFLLVVWLPLYLDLSFFLL